MNLKERVMNQLEGKTVDMTPVGCTTTYGMVELMKKCGADGWLERYEKELAELN